MHHSLFYDWGGYLQQFGLGSAVKSGFFCDVEIPIIVPELPPHLDAAGVPVSLEKLKTFALAKYQY